MITIRKHSKALICLLAIAITATSLGSDTASLTSSFFGIVTVDGNAVPEGTTVTATIDGVELESTIVVSSSEGASFRIDVPGDVPETPADEGGLEGETVAFRVGNSDAPENGVWQFGSHQRVNLTAAAGPDLSISQDDGRDTVQAGESLTYSLTVTNASTQDATGVVVTEELPSGVSLIVASDSGSEAGGIVSWPTFDLAGGATEVRTLTVELAPSFAAGVESLPLTATVADDGSNGFDPDATNNTATDTNALDAAPDLAVTKTDGLTEISPGEDLAYTLTIVNTGTQDAADVALVDTLPAGVTFFTASDDGGETSPGSVTWPTFDLAAGETTERTLNLRFDGTPGATQITNSASATPGNEPDRDPTDNIGTDSTDVAQRIDLDVVAVDTSAMGIDLQSLVISGVARVEIENLGNGNAALPFEISLWEDADGDGVLTGADTVLAQSVVAGGVMSGEVASFDLPVAGSVSFRDSVIYAFADSALELDELDETNNIGNTAEGCIAPSVVEDFAPVVEMSWPANDTNLQDSASRESMSTPIVVQLTDDNGDGQIDGNDGPDIVFVSFGEPEFGGDLNLKLRAIHGDSGKSIWVVDPPISQFLLFSLSGLAAGDIDGDGVAEIVVATPEPPVPPFDGFGNKITAYEHTGQRKWSSQYYSTHPTGDTFTNRDNPTIADLDGDGTPEIVVGGNVFNASGSLRWAGTGGQAYQSASNNDAVDSGSISVVANLDLEGDQEVVTGNTAYRSDGSIYWQVAMDDGYPAVGNFDADDFPEIVVVARGRVRLHEHDGTLIWGPVDLPGAGSEAGGAPTVADFDADGEVEIGVAGSTLFTVFETDGTPKWSRSIQDGSSNMTGSTVFDLDGDGAFEVIYRDETHLRIYRGADGVVLFEDTVSSFTANEGVVVADVDRDGRAEIVVSSDRAQPVPGIAVRTYGIRVYGDANDNWIGTRPIWNQHAYHSDNVSDDGAIPAQPAYSWLTHNTFRANVAPADGAFDAADLTASRIDIDFSAYPQLTFTARIGNGGLTAATEGTQVAFYDGDPAAGGVLIDVIELSSALVPGAFEDVVMGTDAATFGPAEIFVSAGDDGAGGGRRRECRTDNNTYTLTYNTDLLGLVLAKDDGQSAIQPGETTTYTLTAANASLLDRTGVVITDLLPPDTLFISASDGGIEAGGTVTWPAFDLPALSTAARTLTLQVDAAIPVSVSALTNTATVTDDGSQGPDPSPENNTASDSNAVLTVRADAGGPYTGDEGIAIDFDASGSSDRDGTIVAYAWDLDGDGEFDDAADVTASRAFNNDGTYTVSLRVTDDSGEVDTDTASVVVANLPAAVDAGADQTVTEGDAATLTTVTFADPGTADTHTATIDWGDGTVEAGPVTETGGAGSVAGGHTYADDGEFDVEVCVTDDGGASACANQQITVENAEPAVFADGAIDLHSWQAEGYSGTGNWQVTEDGTSVTQTLNGGGMFFYGDFTASGASLEGSLRVGTDPDFNDDDFIGFALGFQPGNTTNPQAEFLIIDWKQETQTFDYDCEPQTAREGLAVSRVFGIPARDELWGHSNLDCTGQGSGVEEIARGFTLGDTGWVDLAEYDFRFEVSPERLRIFVDGTLEFDLTGDFDFGSGRFAFYNFSQSIVTYRSVSSLGVILAEGGTADIAVPFSDPGILDTHSAEIDWRDGTLEPGTVVQSSGGGNALGSHVYADDGEFDVEVCVTDDDGGTGCGSLPATVHNLPPVILASDQIAYFGRGLDLEVPFTDPGVLDTHTATIDWGDGQGEPATVVEAGGSGVVNATHSYSEASAYQAQVCVADNAGDEACDSFEVQWLEPVLDLTVQVLASRFAVRPGEAMTYNVRVSNSGTLPATGLEITLELPPELPLVSVGQGGAVAGRTVTWSLPALGFRADEIFTAEVQAPATLAFGSLAVATGTVTDDGSEGPDALPADNTDTSEVRLWDADTPIVEVGFNLARTPGVAIAVSSADGLYPPGGAVDGDLGTRWSTACGDAVNLGDSPYFEVRLPRAASVWGLAYNGLRTPASGQDFLAGTFQLFDANSRLLHDSGNVVLPAPDHDLILDLPNILGVRRFRFTPTADESCHPGLAELQLIGVYGDAEAARVIEGEDLHVVGLYHDNAPDSPYTSSVDWGDGTTEPGTITELGALGLVAAAHTYPDDGIFALEICVTDGGSHSGCSTLEVDVANAVPDVNDDSDVDLRLWQVEHYESFQSTSQWVVSADGRSVNQVKNSRPAFFYGDFPAFGTRVTGTLRVEDPGDDDDFDNDFVGFALGFDPGDTTDAGANFLLIDWKRADQFEDPSPTTCPGQTEGLEGLAVSRVFGIPEAKELWGKINDSCNGPENGVQQLARGATLGDVGWERFTDYQFTFQVDAERLRVWVDGRLEIDLAGTFENGRLAFFNHSQPLVVYNAFAFEPLVVNEGSEVDLRATFTDPGLADDHSAIINWGDGTSSSGVVQPGTSQQEVLGSHVYGDNPPDLSGYLVEVCVTDDDAGTGCGTYPYQVLNLPPVVDAGPVAAVPAGSPLTLDQVIFTDPGFLDTHTVAIAWGDGTHGSGTAVADTQGSWRVAASHTYGALGNYTAEVCVTDDEGATGCDTFNVAVSASSPPEVTILAPDSPEAETASISASFTDGDVGDSHTATIDWGDGSTVVPAPVTPSATGGSLSGQHVYANDGVYTVEVCVTDSANLVGCAQQPKTVTNVAPRFGTVDLHRWRKENYPITHPPFSNTPPNWVVSSDGREVTQTANPYPTVFYSDFPALGTRTRGVMRLDGDDDYTGFVLGFEPGDTVNPDADYLLVTWKKTDQTLSGIQAKRGLKVWRIRGRAVTLWRPQQAPQAEAAGRGHNPGTERLDRGPRLPFHLRADARALSDVGQRLTPGGHRGGGRAL